MGMKMGFAVSPCSSAPEANPMSPFRAETPTPAHPGLARPGKEKRMLVLDWDEDLSLGVPVVDRDHRRLIDLLNRVHLAGWGDQCPRRSEQR